MDRRKKAEMTDERITDSELDAMGARAEAATPGPWETIHKYDGGLYSDHVVSPDRRCIANINAHPNFGGKPYKAKEIAEFIAHSREDIPRLIAEVRRLREENKRAEKSYEYRLRKAV
jgi:hypothetical protein